MAVQLAVLLAGASQALQAQPITEPLRLQQAQRSCNGAAPLAVTLPERPPRDGLAPGVALVCVYTFSAVPPGQALALFIPGLAAHARITLNGQVLRDTLAALPAPLPSSMDRIVLLPIPDDAWRPGANVIEIRAAGPWRLWLSSLVLGPQAELAALHRTRVLGLVVGPGLVAAAMGTLGLCMLLLWRQRPDPLYGYFGAGTLAWAVHSLWSVLPWPLLTGASHAVAWSTLYVFFAAMLVVFCLRFADWRWPRFERGVWLLVLATPVVLAAAAVAGQLEAADEFWRALLLGLVGTGVAAVARAALLRPSMDQVLVAAAGGMALALGAHDWLLSRSDNGDNPVYLVPYAGLPFVLVVVRLLISRFGQAQAQLARLNTGLAQQVAQQTAALRDAVDDMRHARDAAEAADQAKTRFLAAASHDLRQPAHALALYMAALRAQPLSLQQADLVQRMSASLCTLETLFNQLLDLSRIDAGALVPAPRSFDLAPLLRRLADEFAPQLEARGLRLALHLPQPVRGGAGVTGGVTAGVASDTSAQAPAFSDPVLVERILRNLLANAAKYTQRGGILLACRLRSSGPGAARLWRIEVWDTGVGIAAQYRTRVFEAFFQIDNPGRDRALGTGLGLSIVQGLATLLHLPLGLHSRPGRGTCFTLALPQASTGAVAGSAAVLPVADLALPAALQGMAVGLIEDDAAVCQAMQALLRTWGCRLAHGADADALADALADASAEALIVDQRLQAGRTGPGEAERLFARWRVRLPVLVVSGESDLQPLRDAGRTCLAKPVAPALLAHWLQSVRRAGGPAPGHVPNQPKPQETRP